MKKVTSVVHSAQAVLTIAILVLITFLTPDATMDPLYLPFDVYLLIVGIMLIIVDAESFFFKSFGMKWAKTDSERFLMAKDNMKRGLIVIIVAVILIALINGVAMFSQDSIDTTKDIDIIGYPVAPEFVSQDAFGITGISTITVSSLDGVPLDVYILHREDYLAGNWANRLNIYPGDSEDITNLTYKRDSYLPFDDYVLYMDSHNQTTSVRYTLDRDLSQEIVLYLTIFPGIFAVINAVWVIYNLPMKKRFEKTSIYE
jgi:hypothetical protein